ncbi:hypothetical protein GW17_00053119 [Ensete ventricosum]|nr:hypothetical protein GW17_00053119 [Ensete ventricosum]
MSPMKVQEMAAAREGNADDRGGSSVDDRWQRKIDMVEASSIMQAAMLTAIEGEKGDCGDGAATTVIEVKVIRLLRSLGKEIREVAAIDYRGLRMRTEEEEGMARVEDDDGVMAGK